MDKKKRTIVCGDVHGCLDEFNELLEKLKYDPNQDRLILAGDLVDRGPYSAEMIQRARNLNLEGVMGNHDRKFLNWYLSSNRKDNPKYPWYKKLTFDDVDYLNRLPNYIKLSEDLWVVHAGVKPGIPLEKQRPDDLIYLRYTDKNRKFISVHKVSKGEAPEAMFWTDFYHGPASILYGHCVHSLDQPRIDEVAPGVFCYGLDTGAVFGGNLSAFIVETKEMVQVKAKKIYFKSNVFSQDI